MNYFPLIEKVEIVRGEDADTPRVWYRISGDAALALLTPWRGKPELGPGQWVMLVARVNSVRSSGGYRTGATPPGEKEKPPIEETLEPAGFEFRLEQREIYYFPGLEELRKEKP